MHFRNQCLKIVSLTLNSSKRRIFCDFNLVYFSLLKVVLKREKRIFVRLFLSDILCVMRSSNQRGHYNYYHIESISGDICELGVS